MLFPLASLLLLAALARPVDGDCLAKCLPETELDIENSILTENELQNGGIMKFEDVGFVDGSSIDLEVSTIPGTTYESQKANIRNGKANGGKLGQINLFTVKGDPESGEGSFRFCLRDHETGELATAKSFVFSVFDLDNRRAAKNGIKEKLAINIGQVEDYVLYPDEDTSEIKISCENSGLAPPCATGERTVFRTNTKGTGSDNPSDPNSLDETQKSRVIVFSFMDTSCWDFTYSHFCEIEEEGGKCSWYGGGNFMFAGGAQEVIDGGECIVPPTGGCDNNPDPFFWKGRDTSCDEIAALGPQKQNRKCNEGRRIERECPSVCLEECETPSPTITPTIPRGDCEDNQIPFEYKGKITSCAAVAALGPQKQRRKCNVGRRIPEECPTVCKEECSS
jgi:hypothetical protein